MILFVSADFLAPKTLKSMLKNWMTKNTRLLVARICRFNTYDQNRQNAHQYILKAWKFQVMFLNTSAKKVLLQWQSKKCLRNSRKYIKFLFCWTFFLKKARCFWTSLPQDCTDIEILPFSFAWEIMNALPSYSIRKTEQRPSNMNIL